MPPPNPDPHPSITLARVADVDAVEGKWLELQSRSDCSVFQSWAWVGCLVKERFPDPILLEAHSAGQLVGLALFNRCAKSWRVPVTLWLGENGQPAYDAVFVEHNGPLLARGHEHLLAPCLKSAFSAPLASRKRRLILSGVGDACLNAVVSLGLAHIDRTIPAPKVDFHRLPPAGFLTSLSANARYQIRRSNQRYGHLGPLAVQRARSVYEANMFLDELAILHQRTWMARGKPGAFANPAFRRFHSALIARAHPDGLIDILRITAGERLLGYLYNFSFRGRVSAYQSGFDYDVPAHHKPGLTCHHLAIEMYRAEGAQSYDFLAGGDRYKTSMANTVSTLHWIELIPKLSFRAAFLRAKKAAYSIRRHLPLPHQKNQ